MPAESNFGFLSEYDPLLTQYGLQAELYAYSDSNTSIIKSRQLGEHLAKHTAQHAGLDPENLSFVADLASEGRLAGGYEAVAIDRWLDPSYLRGMDRECSP